MTALGPWQNFYTIVGSSAGALIGLQFVVMSLITSTMPTGPVDPQAGRTFATPTVIHFGTVLALAAALSAPWDGIGPPTWICGVAGLGGVVYACAITVRMRRQKAYKPEFEDWLFHAAVPFAAYVALAGSAYATRSHLREALFGVAAAAMLLLFTGIHNAWDAVTYHVFTKSQRSRTVAASTSSKSEDIEDSETSATARVIVPSAEPRG